MVGVMFYLRVMLRRLSRFVLPGWLFVPMTQAQIRIAITNLVPDEPPTDAAKRGHRRTAPVDRRKQWRRVERWKVRP